MVPLLEEDEVYLGAKAVLRSHGWILLGGQPPSGCDHLPVVEVKLPGRTGIGSKGAYKPDLVAAKDGIFMLIECKPDHSPADADKLRAILRDSERISLLYQELSQRKLFERRGISARKEEFCESVTGALAHSGTPRSMPDLITISVRDISGVGEIIEPKRRA